MQDCVTRVTRVGVVAAAGGGLFEFFVPLGFFPGAVKAPGSACALSLLLSAALKPACAAVSKLDAGEMGAGDADVRFAVLPAFLVVWRFLAAPAPISTRKGGIPESAAKKF